jgi:phosphopantothenoylcysteine decarboxylase/phosphopantothenate--cysteine ligase
MTTRGKSARQDKAKGRRLNIVVTAGPTREFFDSVRFISNPSSGRMGYAFAEAAAAAGHKVTLVSGPVSLDPPANVTTIPVVTAAEMAAAAKRAFAKADAAVFVAAVCDYRPMRKAKQKAAKKTAAKHVTLVPTEDIAAALGRVKGHRITVGFAMEDHAGRRHAERKLRKKRCDAIVLNGLETVGSHRATVEVLTRGGRWEAWRAGSKPAVARRLLRVVERLALDRLAEG